MTLDVMERPTPTLVRMLPRSSLATANVELARRTLAELAEPNTGFDLSSSRIVAKLRSIVVKDEDQRS
jgi:hypothetical protein